MKELLAQYGLNAFKCTIENFGSGLINSTWLIANGNKYILQKINKAVFINPGLIDENLHLIDDYLKQHKPGYTFITSLPLLNGKTMLNYENEFYRLTKFIPSKTYSVVNNIEVAFEAAKQFGKFTKNLSGFNVSKLHETIPHFHDINLRYEQFSEASTQAIKQESINQKK